ncbi:hypothetical protein EB796_009638 [Bugula neritina]|uniref:Fucosyltransferase n=1 Tax=Bugula neritina TaxID=10212 RepID=A0A7J7K264_BUGNE|nr:hypothetical protein EB796_009638 [Bugula neritina]
MHCPIKCHVTSNRSLYADADMVMFEAPKSIKQRVGQTIILNYYRDWGEWPRFRGNNQQVRMFYAREPQLAGLSGRGLAFAEDMFNYTMTFQKEADIFYPYGHTRRLPQPNSITPTEWYDSVAPPYSYIHVDGFSSPKDLSKYLISLDKNNSLYNEYHHWRKSYGIAWENANCELCRLAAEKPTKVTKLSQFWNAEKQCKS